nr:helix-turn-helix domain-containing protein [Actinoplanes lichenis]
MAHVDDRAAVDVVLGGEGLRLLHGDGCPVRGIFDEATSRWATLILAALITGPHRFAQLRDRLDGISEKMLAQKLKAMARAGLITRDAAPTVPPQVTYSLTDLGASRRRSPRRRSRARNSSREQCTPTRNTSMSVSRAASSVRHVPNSMMCSTTRSFPAWARAGMHRWKPAKKRGRTSCHQSKGPPSSRRSGSMPAATN